MNPPDFVHLHVHTQYSLLDGVCRIEQLIKKAVEYQMPAVAMTDHGNIFGAVHFYQTAVKNGIKPIIGCEAYVALSNRFDKTQQQKGTSHLVLLAQTNEGYANLMKLVSLGFLEGFYYKPRMDKEILARHAKGLIATSACLKGEVPWYLNHDDYPRALKAADEFNQIFGRGNFYLELMDHQLPEQQKVNQGLLKISKELNIPVIATNDVHYLDCGQHEAHEALLCIQTQTFLSDPKRMRFASEQFFFKDAQAMGQSFSWIPEALTNTVAIAEKCNVKLDFDHYHLPRYDPPVGKSRTDYLRELCLEGIQRRFGAMTPALQERLDFELKVIEKMDFISYFLIVWDFIHFAKGKGIPVGPGRGSAAGSLVSYLLGITDLDPIKYGLLFERFLNPARSGMPDIDIDFCYERRGEVIDYVTQKYGKDNVAQIITFGSMQAKAAIRDVGRVMSLPYADVDRIAKLVPNEIGITLDDALQVEPQFKKVYAEEPTAQKLIETAKVLEGLNRHASIHAAGVVISDRPLIEHVPLYKTSDDQITTGFDMDGIAKIGLLKMDFLGLKTLTVISDALKLIEKTRGIRVDIDNIPLDDAKTYQMLARASSLGVFQLESSGMRDILKKIKANQFEDLIAILALYRPGPMGSGMLDDFIKRKKGETKVAYPHPKLDIVLKETYGIILYQEQVMQMASVLAGFSMAQADDLRRAMSKKIPEVMEKMRKSFVEGCLHTSKIQEIEGNRLFDLIDYFSGYGFNRSHSAAYALITYRTAYLKANFPVEFMAALLTSEKDNTDKVVEYVKEAEAMGMTVLPPDANESVATFSVINENTIRYGLLAVKNIGALAIDSIIKERKEGGKFKNIFDFCRRVDLRLNNRKVIESLIRCGAFDGFKIFRSQMMAVLDQALELGTKSQKEAEVGQFSFFSMGDAGGGFKDSEVIPDIKEWSQTEILSYEKALLGFYLSGHPLSRYQTEINEFTDYSTKDLKNTQDGQEVKIVALINSVKLTTTKKTNERMAIVMLEDMEGTVEAVVFPSTYPQVISYLKEGSVVIVKCKISFRDGQPKLTINELKGIDEVYRLIKAINVDLSSMGMDGLDRVKEKLSRFPGKTPVYLQLDTKAYTSVKILVGEDLFVSPSEVLMDEIKQLVGEEKFTVTI